MANTVKADAPKLRFDDRPAAPHTSKFMKRFPGMGDRPVYGRDSLFLAHRLRKDYWRLHEERADLKVYKDRLVENQRRAEFTNEVRRIEGFLQHNLTYQSRLDYLRDVAKPKLLAQIGVSALPD